MVGKGPEWQISWAYLSLGHLLLFLLYGRTTCNGEMNLFSHPRINLVDFSTFLYDFHLLSLNTEVEFVFISSTMAIPKFRRTVIQ